MGSNNSYSDILYKGWHVVRKINSGGFGTVYEIEKEDFGHHYRSALKVISVPESKTIFERTKKKNGKDDESLKKYLESMAEDILNEVDYMYTLKGIPNIVNYEDHEFRENSDGIGWQIMIRMELLTPLEDYMDVHHLERENVIKLGIHICSALEQCHSKKIMHRDIKPGNIFVTDQGDFKLGDFGIARILNEQHEYRELSGYTGTLNYMAPEVNSLGSEYGFDVDTYSLGIVMYRLLNNDTLPFHENVSTYKEQSKAIERRFMGEKIPRPCGDNTQLADVVLKACSFRPEDRYESASQMREALEKIMRDEPLPQPSRLASIKKIFRRFIQEKRKLVLSLFVSILIIAGGIWWGIPEPSPNPPVPPVPPNPIIELIDQQEFAKAYNAIASEWKKNENMDYEIRYLVEACIEESEYKRAVASMRMLSDELTSNESFYEDTVRWFYEHNKEFARQVLKDLREKSPEGEALANRISSEFDGVNKEKED